MTYVLKLAIICVVLEIIVGDLMGIKARIFNIMQYEKHPETGKYLMTEEKIKDALLHRTIERWAYIYHDKDVYTELDEERDSRHKRGENKPAHWHIVVEMDSHQVDVSVIARWFGIPENFVNVVKGAGKFLDCVEYLTHENEKQQELGKYRYDDTEIKANFDFRTCLTKRLENRMRYGRYRIGKSLNEKDVIRQEVLLRGMKLSEVLEKHPDIYMDDYKRLEEYRLRYLSFIAKISKARINYYVEGSGGIGKGLISKAIARAIVDREGKMRDEDIFFEVGADKVTFEGYDGQPVIIWNDCRANTLLQKLGGRENVFNVFDPFSQNIVQHVKYGAIRLHNTVNIVNGIQSYSEFLDGLVGEYRRDGMIHRAEDKSQSYRRFPFFLVLHEEDYDLGMNKGVFDGTREYEQYYMYNSLRGNMRRIAEKCGNNAVLYNMVTRQVVSPVVEKHNELDEILCKKQHGTDEEILEEFKDVGKPIYSERCCSIRDMKDETE